MSFKIPVHEIDTSRAEFAQACRDAALQLLHAKHAGHSLVAADSHEAAYMIRDLRQVEQVDKVIELSEGHSGRLLIDAYAFRRVGTEAEYLLVAVASGESDALDAWLVMCKLCET